MNKLFRKKSIAQIQADAAAGFSDAEVVPGDNAGLRRSLGTFDITMLGIAAIIGAGIFAMVGNAANSGGPAVILLFIFAAIACGFSALCYAEFASKIPIAGSAYTYAYASFGELLAWIIGWDLLVEYAIGNIAVAISWSDYFTGLLQGYGINIPLNYTMDYRTASAGFAAVEKAVSDGATLETLQSGCKAAEAAVSCNQLEAHAAWAAAPTIGGLPVVADLPALGIVFLITVLVYVGIRESKTASNIMVALKLAVILLVIVLGAFYVNPANWSPFAPNGFTGVMAGVAAVFFAYIGFDALSTTAEECKNPHRDLPRGMIFSLLICTVLYVALALVLTGMVSYTQLAVGDPLAFVFGPEGVNIPWVSGIIAISAVIAIATVLLVFQLGQPRLWMAMSRDGLLPKIFSSIHPKFRTPWFSTILTGLMVAIPALFMNLSEVTDLSVIGTLFAFSIVCAGVLVKDKEFGTENRYVPYINSQFIIPALFLTGWILLFYFNGAAVLNYLTDFSPTVEGESTLGAFSHKIPYLVFAIYTIVIAVLCFVKRLTLIPVLGLTFCFYLMTELGITNWIRFSIWLGVGLLLYFVYGFSHSKLNNREEAAEV
jgi:basic amino acid/polyamine antiporter, APA family